MVVSSNVCTVSPDGSDDFAALIFLSMFFKCSSSSLSKSIGHRVRYQNSQHALERSAVDISIADPLLLKDRVNVINVLFHDSYRSFRRKDEGAGGGIHASTQT